MTVPYQLCIVVLTICDVRLAQQCHQLYIIPASVGIVGCLLPSTVCDSDVRCWRLETEQMMMLLQFKLTEKGHTDWLVQMIVS